MNNARARRRFVRASYPKRISRISKTNRAYGIVKFVIPANPPTHLDYYTIIPEWARI